MVGVEILAVFTKSFVHQVVHQCIAVAVALEGFPTRLLCALHARRLACAHDVFALLEIGRPPKPRETVHVVTDDEVAVVCQHRRQVRAEGVLLILYTVVFLIGEVKMLVLKVDERRGVRRTIHRTAALQLHGAGV